MAQRSAQGPAEVVRRSVNAGTGLRRVHAFHLRPPERSSLTDRITTPAPDR